MQDFLTELEWRGLFHQSTVPLPELAAQLSGQFAAAPVYCGFDPTADSLHVGHLVALISLARWQQAGHKPLAIVGGGTGFIGDPSGKSEERSLLSIDAMQTNIAGQIEQLRLFLDFSPGKNQAEVLNNFDWLNQFTTLDFLRNVGKHFTVNRMLEKESVRLRLEDREQGLSFTEFSYMLLQAADYLHLFDAYGCRLQIGGSDQYGNITAGIDLIRRKRGAEAYGLTFPLLTRADGKKFGKTEEGAVWLSAKRTSPYAFFQYWINVPDTDIGRYLLIFSNLSKKELEDLERRSAANPEARERQRVLARLLTRQVHGVLEVENAEKASSALFGAESLTGLDEAALLDLVKEAPSSMLAKNRLAGTGVSAVELLAETTLWKSRGEVKKAIPAGGAYLNGERISDLGRNLTSADLLHGKYLVLRKGKRSYHLIRCE